MSVILSVVDSVIQSVTTLVSPERLKQKLQILYAYRGLAPPSPSLPNNTLSGNSFLPDATRTTPLPEKPPQITYTPRVTIDCGHRRTHVHRRLPVDFHLVTCASYARQAGTVFGNVCASVCMSVCTKSRKLLLRNQCNLVGICLMGNARSTWKLTTFDLDLWPWELFSYFFYSGYTFTMAWPRNFIFGMEIHLLGNCSVSRSWV